MTIERKTDAKGAVTEVIKLTAEENSAINDTHLIVEARYKELGLQQTDWEKEHLEYSLQGLLRYEGIDAMLNWARTAIIRKEKDSSTPRGDC